MKRMPLWFRLAIGGLATLLLVPFVVLKTGVGSDAMALALRAANEGIRPLLATDAMMAPRMELATDGSYSINGMPVEFHTYPVRGEAASITRQFQRAFENAGYEQAIIDVQGGHTLVAIHPDTKMMLTARLVRDRVGTPGVRVTQQDLSKLDPAFEAEIPGMPVYSRATQPYLVSSIEGPPSQSLTYWTQDSADVVEHFYRGEMRAAGWHLHAPPVRLPEGSPVSLFFQQGRLESSLVIVPGDASTPTFVMLTLTGDPTELS